MWQIIVLLCLEVGRDGQLPTNNSHGDIAKLSTKMTSMSRMEQWRERSEGEGGVIEKGEDLGDDGFQLFW